MYSLVIILISITIAALLIVTVSLSSKKKFEKNEKELNVKTEIKTLNETITSEKIKKPVLQEVKTVAHVIEKQQIEHINTYDFKNTESVYIPILTLFIIFIIFKKFNNISSKLVSFINTLKTKSLLNDLNKNNTEHTLKIINKIEIQLTKNKYLLESNNYSTDLQTYNELLNSKSEFIINNMINKNIT